MRHILLPSSPNTLVLIDDEDFDRVNEYSWHINKYVEAVIYNKMKKKYFNTLLHRFIMNAQKDQRIDHIDRNPFNNQKSNLRPCTNQQNLWNTALPKHNTSGYKGVSWCKRDKRWYSAIILKGKHIHLGCFTDKYNAFLAYEAKAKELRGEFYRPQIWVG